MALLCRRDWSRKVTTALYIDPWNTLHQCLESGCENQQRQSRERQPARKCIIHEYWAGEREWPGSWIEHAASDVRKRHGWHTAGRMTGSLHLILPSPFQFTPACQREQLRCTAGRPNMRWMRSWVSVRASAITATIFARRILFSWSSAGHRNITSSGTRYFSINGGVTNIVDFNQDPDGDFGDWLSAACPQAHPYVQNAFSCPGQSSDIAATSPEGINLDVIGYDLVGGAPPTPTPTATPRAHIYADWPSNCCD